MICFKATQDYQNGIPGAIAKRSMPYYFPENENMEIGFYLAKCSALLMIVASVLMTVFIGLYVPFGEGKWIWQTKIDTLLDTERGVPLNTELTP